MVHTAAAEQSPQHAGTGEQPMPSAGADQQPKVRSTPAERPPVRAGAGEGTLVGRGSGEHPQVRGGTGEQPSAPAGAGSGPLGNGEQPTGLSDGQQLPTTGTGNPAQTQFSTGERPRVRSLGPSGNPADDGSRTPHQPQPGTPIANPADATPASAEDGAEATQAVPLPPAVTNARGGTAATRGPADPAQATATRDDETAAGSDSKPPAGAESLETVDLASRMEPPATTGDDPDGEEPGPDTTAVLEMRPTADVSSRPGPTAEESHPPS
jgi:hypothetical protein